MERSDPQRPSAADPAVANPEAPKPAAPVEAPPPGDPPTVRSDPQSSGEAAPLIEDESDAIERAYFDLIERETTQPVGRYMETPQRRLPDQPDPSGALDYVAELSRAMQAVDPEAGAPSEVPGEDEPQSPAPQEEAAQDTERTFQPSPFSVPAPSAFVPKWARRPLINDADDPPQSASDVPAPNGAEEPPVAAQERIASSAALRTPPSPSIEPNAGKPEPVAPHAVAAPSVEPRPPPGTQQVDAGLPPPIGAQHLKVKSASPPPIPSPPPIARPKPSFRLEVPPREDRHEPTFRSARPAPSLRVPRREETPEPALAGGRDWRDLARRAANVAFLVFAGWLIAVLLLIVVYRFVNPPFSMLMAQRFLGGTAIDNTWVPIESISPNLSRAVIVAEDGRFCQHWGVDFVEAADAIRRASDGYPRGASTITMQVAKNLFLVPAKSYLRKMVEIPLTFAIELAWPKKRILEVYLNIVEWGPGIFGAEAASQAHFGRSAAGLSARQAAQLAAVLPNPIVRDAGDPGPRTAHKASIIQARAARTREASSCIDRAR